MTWCGNLIIVTFCNHRFALVMITIMSKSISISKNICTVRIIATDFPKKDLFLCKGNNCVSFKCITIKWSETVSDSCYWWLKVATYQCPYCYFWKNNHERDLFCKMTNCISLNKFSCSNNCPPPNKHAPLRP